MQREKGLIGWIILFTLTGGIVTIVVLSTVYAPKSLPGDLIYPIKEIKENLIAAQYEFDFIKKADVYLNSAQKRLVEIKKLIKRFNKEKELISTIQKLQDTQKKALNNMGQAKNRNKNLDAQIIKLNSIIKEEQEYFPQVISEVSEPVAKNLQKVIDQSELDSRILESLKGH